MALQQEVGCEAAENIANLLKELAKKALAALLGIIGSIVSWLISFLAMAATFAAEHVYLFMAFVVALTRRQ